MNRKTLLSAAAGLLGGLIAAGGLWASLQSAASAPPPTQSVERLSRELAITNRVIGHLELQLHLAIMEAAELGPGASAAHKQAGRLVAQLSNELDAARAYAVELYTGVQRAEYRVVQSAPNGDGWTARLVP